MPAARRFPFRDDARYRWVLRPFGVWGDRAMVEMNDTHLLARFGLWHVLVPRSEIVSAEVTGPYSAIKVLGVRMSAADRGLTFGTSDQPGVCMQFARPVRGAEPFGVIRHPGLTVTVDDPEGLVTALDVGR